MIYGGRLRRQTTAADYGGRLRRVAVTSLIVMGMLAITCAVSVTGSVKPAFACPTTSSGCTGGPYGYEHSWYLTDVSASEYCSFNGATKSAMSCLADRDARQANYICANNQYVKNFLTVLDIGRPAHFSGGYGIVSSWIGGQNYLDTDVQAWVQDYATEWYNATTPCPHLTLVIGTGNDYECYIPGTLTMDSNCSVYTAGATWDTLAHNVESYLSGKGYSWQITAWPGDDIEGSWDQPVAGTCTGPSTLDFINGMGDTEHGYSSHLNMIDFGDADWGDSTIQSRANQPSCSNWALWSQQHIYDAAWGLGWDVPFPETYNSGQTGRWSTVYTNSSQVSAYAGAMQFYGNMTECTEGDQLSTGNCYVQGNYDCEYGPEQGYLTLGGDVNQSWYSSTYSSNIQFQGSSQTGNGGC